MSEIQHENYALSYECEVIDDAIGKALATAEAIDYRSQTIPITTATGRYIYYNTLKIGDPWTSTLTDLSENDESVYLNEAVDVSGYAGYTLAVTADTIGPGSARAFGFADSSGNVTAKFSERMLVYDADLQKYTIQVPIKGDRFFFSASKYMTGLSVRVFKKAYTTFNDVRTMLAEDVVYVSENGDDTDDGTAFRPFRSIQKAVDSGAETVKVYAGQYEPFSISNRTKPIKIMLADYPPNPASGEYYPAVLPHIEITDETGDHIWPYAIKIDNCSDVYISDVEGYNVKDNIFDIDNTSRIEMVRCIAHDNNSANLPTKLTYDPETETPHEKCGFSLKNVNGIFRECESYNVTLDGFNIHGCGDTQFINCVAHDCIDDGISHHERCTGLIQGGEYCNCRKGGVASPTYGAKIQIENVYSHHNKFGAYIAGSNQNASIPDTYGISNARIANCVFVDNNAYNNGGYDIQIAYANVTMADTVYGTKKLNTGAVLTEYRDNVIESVKLNGTALTPDADKTVNIVIGLNDIIAPNAGAHNSVYRGKYLGDHVTDAQWAAIAAGTFEDLFIGDYWIINGVTWRIAAFNYWLYTGHSTACTAPHVLIVPDAGLVADVPMNSTNTTTGAYVGSDFYTGSNSNTAKAQCVSIINAAFGSTHILSHREFLKNATTNGYESSGGWFDSTVELMTEQMVYGCKIYGNCLNASSVPGSQAIDNSQLPLFALDHACVSVPRKFWWLRDVVNPSSFACVSGTGVCSQYSASYNEIDIRPVFAIQAEEVSA